MVTKRIFRVGGRTFGGGGGGGYGPFLADYGFDFQRTLTSEGGKTMPPPLLEGPQCSVLFWAGGGTNSRLPETTGPFGFFFQFRANGIFPGGRS